MRSRVALRLVMHDRSATAGALLGVVAIVFLVGQQLSVLFGLFNYMSVLVDHSGADAWVMSAGTRNSDAGNLISGRYVDRIAGLPEVASVQPLLLGNALFRTADGAWESVRLVGVRMPGAAVGPWAFAEGGAQVLLDGEAVAIDRLDLGKLGNPQVGSITEIGGHRVRIGAVTAGARSFQGTLVFAALEKVRDIIRTPPGRYSAILVNFAPGADKGAALAHLRRLLPGNDVFSTAALSRRTRAFYFTNTGIGASFGFSTVIAVMIGVVIISLTLYTSVMGRTQDFAVLRAMGARRRDIALVVVQSGLIITGAGLLLGFLLLATLLNATTGTDVPSHFPAYVPPLLALTTLAVSMLGSLVALRVALRAEPAAVFH